MSEPRMISADGAKQLRESITPGRWRLNERESVVGLKIEYWDGSAMEVANVKLAEASPDLAHTVVEQAETIQTLSQLLADAEEAATERADQIERVRKALLGMQDYDAQAQYEWDTKADMFAQGVAMGYSMAAQWLEEALGDTANHTEQENRA